VAASHDADYRTCISQNFNRLWRDNAAQYSRSTHDRDVKSNSLLDSLSESLHWLGPAPPPMYPRISLEGLPGRATNRLRREMSYRKDDDADPRFFFLLIGLAYSFR
jgi:hypothetical protein